MLASTLIMVKWDQTRAKTHLPFICPSGQHHELTMIPPPPSEIISSFQYQINKNAWNMLNKNWHILPHFLFIQDAQSQRISRSRGPISTWRRFVPWQSSGSGMVLSLMGWAGLAAEEGHPWHRLGAGFWGKPLQVDTGMKPQLFSAWAPAATEQWQQSIQVGMNPLFLPV